MTSPSTRTRRAFTLVELVAACAVTAILLMSIASAVIIASRALPDQGSASRSLAAAEVLELFTSDLAYAKALTRADDAAIGFTIADRDGDGQPDQIEYRWQGAPGGAFIRSFNGVDSVLIESVADCAIELTTRKLGPAPAATSTTSDEMVLFETGPHTSTASVTASTSFAQGFLPVLPADTTAWSITRVEVYLSHNSPTLGTLRVQLYTADFSGAPSGAIRSQNSFAETLLPAAPGWHNALLPPVPNISPSQPMAIVLRHSGAGDASAASLSTTPGVGSVLGLGAPGARVMSATLLGLWTPDLTRNLVVRVHGTVNKSATPEDTRPTVASTVTIALSPHGASSERLRSAVALANTPALP